MKFHDRLFAPIAIVLLAMLGSHARAETPAWQSLLPTPTRVEAAEGRYRLSESFAVAVSGNPDKRAYAEATRALRRLSERTGLLFSQAAVDARSPAVGAGLLVAVERPGQLIAGEDESYRLRVSPDGARIDAATDLGALLGLETLLQLLSADADGYSFPAVEIEDAPRFPWRGLMIDSSRHFMPLDVIKRNLDGMAAVKLNVLHWHLTDDQGFRVESLTHPRLHELGSDGLYYTQDEIRELIAYAGQRGIRVYPEFDVPGHATAWLVGHPEIGSAPGPYEIERAWGIFDPTLDPTNERTYELLDAFFGEMAALFPDAYMHIGGDEVSGKHWQRNEKIQAFMKERGIADLHGLQSHFNVRILEILTKHGKQMVGWDEILQPGMPTNIVIHSWRGRESMEKAAREGYRSILSNGYYIDLMQPASFHYANDPLPADTELSGAEQARVLGGEATMWSEHVTEETVDSRIWPRTAAIAERLWSPSAVSDVDDLYRRLDLVALQLEEHGLAHLKNRAMMMRRLAGGYDFAALQLLADLVEPLKVYERNADHRYRSYSPYTLLPDIAIADAPGARRFNADVAAYSSSGDADARLRIEHQLASWRDNHAGFEALADRSPALREALPLSAALRDLAALGLGAKLDAQVVLRKARQPVAKVELQVVDAVERLLKARESARSQ